ncbi:MAG: carboxypeptidase regulatory-like domain-containing protein [Theionarchaea archaeon]|nr:carboxypeptidase regulatory-like domain-containing protein [Theionarchaea archaeon]
MENRKAKRGLSLLICITLIGSLVIFGAEEANAQPYAIAGLIYADVNMNGIYDPANGDYIIAGDTWTDANANDRFDWLDANGNGLMEAGEAGAGEWVTPGDDIGLAPGFNPVGAGDNVFEGPEVWLDQPNAPVSPTCTANENTGYALTGLPLIPANYPWTHPLSNYILRNLQPGYHWVTVRCPGFYTQTKNVTVFGNVPVNFGLIPFDSITGRLVKTDGTGICGMWVTATATSLPYSAQNLQINTLSDAAGNYVLKGLPPGQYTVMVNKVEYIPQQKLNITVDGRTYPNTPFMVNARTTTGIDFINLSYNYGIITGLVIGPQGVVVEVPGLGLSTTTDAAGTYTIGNIPAGWYYVTYKATGWFIGVQFVCVGPGPGVTILPPYTMSACGPCTSPTIEGSITDGIQAIENAIIEVPGMGWVFGSGMEVYTDKAGYYILTDLGTSQSPSYVTHVFMPTTGRFFVVVRNEAGIILDEWDDHHKSSARGVEITAGRITRADFKLEENPDYKFGRVTNTDGIGIEGAKVYVPNSPYTTVTDSNGYFFLSLPAETYSEGCIMTWQANIRPGRRREETILCGFRDIFQRGIANRLPSPESAFPRRMYKARYLIVAEKPNYFDAILVHISSPGPKGINRPPAGDEGEPGAPIDDCEQCMNTLIMTIKTGILKGQVKDSSGNYLNDGFVFVCGRDVPIRANGWFETLEVPVGTYTAVVTDATKLQILGVIDGVQVRYDQITYKTITLPASPPGKFISGFVYHNTVRRTVAPDAPVDGVAAWQGYIIPDQNGYSPGTNFEPGEGISGVTVKTTFGGMTAYTDSYGFYIIKNVILPTGTSSTTIVASKADYITLANPSVAPSDGLNFVNGFAGGAGVTVFPMSKRRGTLNGRVVNEDGRDVSGATVSVWIPWERKDETDTNGFYIFENLEIGTYLMKICGGGECGIDYWVTYSVNEFGQGEPVVLNSIVTKDFTYKKRTGRVHGFVTNNAAPPQLLQDAEVVLSGKYKELTDCNGFYTILDVPTGTHTGTAYKAGYQMRKYQDLDASIGVGWSWYGGMPVRVDWAAAGAALPVPNPNPPAVPSPLLAMTTTPITGWISGYLTLELTDGFCEVHVRVNPSGQHVVTDSEGYYIILNIQPWDQYYLHMEITNYQVETKGPIAVSAGIETKVPIAHLKRYSCTVSGHVREGAEPVAGVQVKLSDMHRTQLESSLYGRHLGHYMTTTDGSGYYEFNDVPWSDAQISDLNKTWAWTVVATKTDYYVGVLNVVVVWPDCGVNNANINLISMNGGISGTVTWDASCASEATVTVSQVLGGSGGGSATVSSSGDTYLIKNLPPGAYDVTATAGSCILANAVPPPPYTGAYAVPVNSITTDIDFAFQTSGAPQPPPDAPTLISPANGATDTSCTPTLDWSDSTGATTYTVQVSVASNFSSLTVNQTVSSSQYTIPSGVLTSFTMYYWRVNATNINGTSGWSAVWHFTTGDCGGAIVPDPPTLISPSNGATDTSCTPTLDWSDSTGATSYTVQVSTDDMFSSTIVNQTVSVSQYTIPNGTLSSFETYFWRANASNSAGTSGWSAVWNFTTGDCGWVCPGNVCGTTDPPECTVRAYLAGHLKNSAAPFYYETTSDAQGHFYFNLPSTAWDPLYEQEREPSIYNIVVSKDGYVTEFKSVEITSITVTWYDKDGSVTDGNFTLGTTGTDISGTVTNGSSGIQDATVRAYDTDHKGTLVKVGSATTDASGDYTLPTLLSGRTYVVSARKSNYTIKTNNVSATTSSNNYTLQQVDGSSVISYTVQLRYNPADNLYDVGWNMVSIPLNVDPNTPLPVLLFDIDDKWMQVTRLKPGTGFTPPGHAAGGAWEIYPNSPFTTTTDNVFTLHETTYNGQPYRYGYWVKVAGNTSEQTYNWVIVGTPNTNKSITLRAGWNLAGLATQTNNQSFTSGGQISFSPNSVLQIWSYDAYAAGDPQLGDHWYAYIIGGYQSSGFTVMKVGLAYYVYVSQECTMTYA